MITLYHAPLSRSCRVRWLLEELGLEHRIVALDIRDGSLKTPEYRAVNPLGKVPTIQTDGVTMFESGAIIEWLGERDAAGRLSVAPGTPGRPAYLQWLHWGEATLLPPLADLAQHAVVRPPEERIPAVVPDAVRRLRDVLGALDRELAGKEYLVGGSFSAADVSVGYGLQLARLLGQLNAQDFPQVAAYLERLAKRPAFQKAFGA
jgi:glutathione S-transferase